MKCQFLRLDSTETFKLCSPSFFIVQKENTQSLLQLIKNDCGSIINTRQVTNLPTPPKSSDRNHTVWEKNDTSGLSRSTVSSKAAKREEKQQKNSPAFSSGAEFVKRRNQVEIN